MCTKTDIEMDLIYDRIWQIVDEKAMRICTESSCRLLHYEIVDGEPYPACTAMRKVYDDKTVEFEYPEKQEQCPRLKQYPRICQRCQDIVYCDTPFITSMECKKNEM